MAFVALVPVTLNMSVTQGLGQEFIAPIVNSPTGTAIDLSAWVSLTCDAIPIAPGPVQAPVAFGTVAGAAGGALSVQTGASDLSSGTPGTAKLVIKGKPTSGDAYQVLATGILTLNQGS